MITSRDGGSVDLHEVTPSSSVRAIAEELCRAGVRDVVICPGSRSTPLALAIAAETGLRTWIHVDERAAAFFALGLARSARRPSAILVTSGTAAVNLAPAVAEASLGRVPLILLTADRPPELRDRGANQTIDQQHLFGRQTRWYAELPVPDGSARSERHLRGVIGRAVATAAAAPAGPVQLDLPFREPLVPEGSLVPEGPLDPGSAETDEQTETPYADVVDGARSLAAADVARLAARVARARRGLIVCGPLDDAGFAGAVTRLAEVAGLPILADALSNVRVGPHDRSHVIVRSDALARSMTVRRRLTPDLVLRFGATPTSRAVGEMLAAGSAEQIVFDDGGWTEVTLLPLTMVWAAPALAASALADALATYESADAAGTPDAADARDGDDSDPADGDWLETWRRADAVADAAMSDHMARLEEPFEGAIFDPLAAALPDGAVLFAGNSMPVRDLDAFLRSAPTALRCLGNRGVSGIDGLVSTALGVSAGSDGPVVLVLGDISFIHDLNALVALRGQLPALTIVLVDNDGGGIFSFLPQAAADRPDVGLPARFEELFGTPHGLDLGALVSALGAEHHLLEGADIGAAVASAIDRGGVQVLQLRSDRAGNVRMHREVAAAAEAALSRSFETDARA